MTDLITRAADRWNDAWERVRETFLALPGVSEGSAYGTPIFNIGKKMLGRFPEGGVMVLKVSGMTRDVLLDTEPATYFLEDHYRPHPASSCPHYLGRAVSVGCAHRAIMERTRPQTPRRFPAQQAVLVGYLSYRCRVGDVA
jgi:hypothetical protein